MTHDTSIEFINMIVQMNLEVRDLWDEEVRWREAMNHWRSSKEESFEFVLGEVGEWSCGRVSILTSSEAWRCDNEMKNFDWRVVNGSIGALRRGLKDYT
ncbi:hypothetical protein NPIL_62071 [Nephila pilipes]|uniref:Uncharacterized protein n=1 Tax=Nephila pilipes TaxID=299642 RepID=A0A8X6TTN5_NEPPI|nr:hypothetical protein NPIL_62071 [Nephila pilipes]